MTGGDTFDPGAMLESLRWDVDYMVWNHFEYVWLKADIDENGNRRGITDCCLAEAPCDHHAAIAAERAARRAEK